MGFFDKLFKRNKKTPIDDGVEDRHQADAEARKRGLPEPPQNVYLTEEDKVSPQAQALNEGLELRTLLDEYIQQVMISIGMDEARRLQVTFSNKRLITMSNAERQELLRKMRQFHHMQQTSSDPIMQAIEDFKKDNPDF